MMVRRNDGVSTIMKPPKRIGPKPAPMETRLLFAIIASATFAGGFVGLLMIGHFHG